MIETVGLCYTDPASTLHIPPLSCRIISGNRYGIESSGGFGSAFLGLLAGVLPPDDGSVRINGFDLYKEPLLAKKLICYLPNPFLPDPLMTVYEYLDWIAGVYHISGERRFRSVHAAMEFTGLDIFKDRLISKLSDGDLPFLGLSQFLASGADILLADMPTKELSKDERELFNNLFTQLPDEKTLLLVGDDREDLCSVCNEILTFESETLLASAPEDTAGRLEEQKADDGDEEEQE